jgi:hyaluronan synthase
LFLIYGVVVTPFLIFRFFTTYRYKPLTDQGFRPHISVVIPVFNEETVISKTIDSVLQTRYPKEKLEIIVIDDKSTDNTLQVVAQKTGIKVLAQPTNKGKRHALELGVKNANGEIIVCVDSDTVLDPDAITNIVQPLTNPAVYCVCGNGIVANELDKKQDNLLSRLQKVWYADSFRIRKGVESQFGMVICCSGVLSAYRKDKFLQVVDQWLNETFLGHEVVSGDDRQMTNLMLQMGGKSKFQSNAIAYTFAPYNTKKFVSQQLRWGRSAFRGMLYASKFFYKKPLSQRLLFYTTMFVNLVSPFSLFMNTFFLMALGCFDLVVFYLFGLLLLSIFFAVNDNQLVFYFSTKDMFYRVLFMGLSVVITFVYLYAFLTPWKGKKWLTR